MVIYFSRQSVAKQLHISATYWNSMKRNVMG